MTLLFCDDESEVSEFFDVVIGFISSDFNYDGLFDWLFVGDDGQGFLFGFCEFGVACCEFVDKGVIFFSDVHFP